MAVTDTEYRAGMRQLAAAVSVVCAQEAGVRNGLTATAVVSLSAEPPRIGVAINRSASALPLLLRSGCLAVNVLGYDQDVIASRFADKNVKGDARFEGADWTTLSTGAPVLATAAATFDCKIDGTLEVGTHLLVIGAVEAVRTRPQDRPLLFLDGTWASLIKANASQLESYVSSVELIIQALDRARSLSARPSEKLSSFVFDLAMINIELTRTTRDFLNYEPYMAPAMLHDINRSKNAFDAKLKQLIEEGIRAGEFKVEDSSLAALAITGMVAWIHRWYRREGRLSPNEVGEMLARMVLGMLGAPATHAVAR